MGRQRSFRSKINFTQADKWSAFSTMKPILLRTEEAANLCNTPPKTWRMWNKLGKVPQPLKIGRLHFWRYDELVSWVDAGCPSRKSWNYQNEKKSEQPIKRRSPKPDTSTKP